MPMKSWRWLKKELLHSNKRRESAPAMSSEKYDPNAHRPEYLQAFDEFKQRGSLYNQLIIREERQESGSRTPNTPTDQSNSNGAQHDQSEAMKQRSLPNKMSRSVFSPSTQRKSKTANNTLAVNENNNSIYVKEILEFEGNCINDESFGGATNQSPPKTFYRNNSNPFSPNAQKPVKIPFESSSVPMQSESASPKKVVSKIEQSRQRACKKLLSYVRPKVKSETSSNSSGAYRPFDLDSSVDEEGELKISNGRSIPLETYNEIANAFEDFTQRNGVYDVQDKHNNSQNSSVSQPNDHEFSSPSAFTSYRRCEGVIDENFGFLNETKWRMEESELTNHGGSSIQVTDLDESAGRLSEYGESVDGAQRENVLPEMKCNDQHGRNVDSSSSPEVDKRPFYVMECKAKDIKPKSSSLRNTTSAPFQLSSGMYRQTNVTLKKCCPRDSSSLRLVEEAIKRDFEILSLVKHPHIIILMAASFNHRLINHMTLVMEPVDYTLHFYLNKMKKTFTVVESISIVQQIASAALYLQECGYIHSNISSHNVLFRERPCGVKLSSFELATAVDYATVRAEIEDFCSQFGICQPGDYSKHQLYIGAEQDNVALKELSKRSTMLKRFPTDDHDYMNVPSKYLVYDTIYRQHLSVANLTAPELLAIDQRFVFPTPETDVYSLCLLLWELLNYCVPLAVYSRSDMERMIASKKLNLPIFEHERCSFFLDIFGAALVVEPKNRTMSLPHLLERLEDIELEILTGGEGIPEESNECNGETVELEHDYVNGPQQAQIEYFDESVKPSAFKEPAPLICSLVNAQNDFFLSPSLLDFDRSLKDCERTSTKKMKKKPSRNRGGCGIRELFPSMQQMEHGPPETIYPSHCSAYTTEESEENAVLYDSEDGIFAELNRSFIEMSDDVRRHVFYDIDEDEKLNRNLANIAEDIRRNILNDTEEFSSIEHQPKHVHSELVQSLAKPNNTKTAPTVVGFSVKNKNLNESKTQGNFLETPVSTAAKKLFDFSPSEYCEERMDDEMPNFARQNYNRRNAWLSNQEPNTANESEHTVEGNGTKANSVDASKKVNVSLRIVHNKMTPEKAPKGVQVQSKAAKEERPSILSKIQFFNSANQTSRAGNSLPNDKHLVAPAKLDEKVVSSSNKPTSSTDKITARNKPTSKSVNERVITAVPSNERKFVANNITFNGMSKGNRNAVVMSELNDVVHNWHNGPLDPPQKKDLFENKLWKRELSICNKSLNSSNGGVDGEIAATKFNKVKDAVLRFEKRCDSDNQSTSNSSSTSNELLKPLRKLSTTEQSSDTPTLVKQTVTSEKDVNLYPQNNAMANDKLNGDGQKVVTPVSSRQTDCEKTDVRRQICGNDEAILSFIDENFCSEFGKSNSITVCCNFVDECLSSACVHSNSNPGSPKKRCHGRLGRVETQGTRSIEDLYIDDDFLHGCHGLGANMELQSDYSDSLDFDMISSGLF